MYFCFYRSFDPPLLNLAMQPNGSANNRSMTATTGKNCRAKDVCNKKLKVENATTGKFHLAKNLPANLWFYAVN